MAHDHHHHGHYHEHASGNIGLAFFLNLGFTVVEIVGGLWTNSIAILSDALHDLGDSFTLGASWLLQRKSRQGRDERYSYGYRRYSLLGALISAIVLLAGSVFILSEAIPRLTSPETPNARGMLGLAVLGVLVNGAAALRLRGDSSLNARIVGLHLLEDVLGWIGVLVVSLVLLVKDIPILDPILSIIITAYVLYNLTRHLRSTLGVFLQAVPGDIDVGEIREKLKTIEGVEEVHHAHTWSLDGEHHVLTAHIVVGDTTTFGQAARIKHEAKDLLKSLHFPHATLEIETLSEECGADP
jgi:cobalt-zinc-cadmium efflux system protein